MKTTVILDGVMGKKFGKKWELMINSPAEAIRLIAANCPEFPHWIKQNLKTYENYRVTCEYENGVRETIDETQLEMLGKLKKIRFTPLVAGSGNTVKVIAGIVLFTIGVFTGQTWLMAIGASLVVGGVVGMLTPQPKINTGSIAKRADGTSYYFDGPVNTTMQGVAVPLIYGKSVLTGSHPISVSLTVDEEAI